MKPPWNCSRSLTESSKVSIRSSLELTWHHSWKQRSRSVRVQELQARTGRSFLVRSKWMGSEVANRYMQCVLWVVTSWFISFTIVLHMLHVSLFYSLMIAPEDIIYHKVGVCYCQLSILGLVRFNFLGPLYLTRALLFIKWKDVTYNRYNKALVSQKYRMACIYHISSPIRLVNSAGRTHNT